jgi:hypothetical protein
MSTAGRTPETKGAGGQVTTIFTTVTQGGPRCLFRPCSVVLIPAGIGPESPSDSRDRTRGGSVPVFSRDVFG